MRAGEACWDRFPENDSADPGGEHENLLEVPLRAGRGSVLTEAHLLFEKLQTASFNVSLCRTCFPAQLDQDKRLRYFSLHNVW